MEIIDVPADPTAAPLYLSVFDAHHALVTHLTLGTKALPLVAVAYNLPDKVETVRVVVTRAVATRQLGAAKVMLTPHTRVPSSVAVSAATSDSDGDGIPDSVDNCPSVANPDQASSSGAAGDACTAGDMAVSSSKDMSAPIDLTAADLSGTNFPDGSAAYNFSYTLPTHQSLYYGSHDKAAATISFSSTADSVTCSHDGVHFAPCDSPTSIIFTPDDYNNGATLGIQLHKAGMPTVTDTLTPKVLMPNLQFFNCDVVITNSEPTAMFQQQLAPNRVLCLAAAVNITDVAAHTDDAGNPLNLSGIFLQSGNSTGMKILGVESEPPTFFNPAYGGNQGIFISMDSTVHDMVFSNLILTSSDGNPISFDMNGGRNAFSNLLVSTGGGGDNAALFNVGTNDLYNVTIHVDTSGSTPGLQVGGTAAVNFNNGHITGRNDTSAIVVNGGTLNFNNSTVDNSAQTMNAAVPTVQVNGGSFNVTGSSVITGLYSSAIDVSNNARLSLVSTTVTGAIAAIKIASGTVATCRGVNLTTSGIGIQLNSATMAIDNTTIARLDQTGTAGPAISVMATSNIINSAMNGNVFCDKNKAGSNVFSGALVNDAASNGMYTGSFNLAKQVNMGMVGQCP